MLFFKLSLFYLFYFASVGVYIIYLPKVLNDIGYSAANIGILLALAPLMRFATPFLFLKHIKLDRNVFKFTLLLTILSAGLFYFTIYNFYAFLFNNAILGVCLSLLLPYIETISLNHLGGNRYGKVRLFGSIGFMSIALILGKFLDTPSTALHYYFITTLVTTIFAFLLLEYDEIEHKDKEHKNFSLISPSKSVQKGFKKWRKFWSKNTI